MNVKSRLLVCAGMLAFAASADTVALWPLNWDDEGGRLDGRCAIDAANDLQGGAASAYDWGTTNGLEWTQALSPDGAVHLFDPVQKSVVLARGVVNYASSATAARFVRPDRDFTLEGWFRVPELPATGSLFFMVDCDGGDTSASDQRWFLTLRNKSGAYMAGCSWQLFAPANGIGDKLLHPLTEGEAADVTRGWHHFALTYAHQVDGTNAVWRFYQDGVAWGCLTGKVFTATAKGNGFFGLGGRNNSANTFSGGFANCRLSDRVLEPSEFMGHAPVETVGYWRLGRTENGDVDGAPSVGSAHFTSGAFAWTPTPGSVSYSDSLVAPDADCAFSGNPPNTTVSLSGGNAGSMLLRQKGNRSTMRLNRIGRELSLTNDFTVEGWVKVEPRDDETADNGYYHLVGTRVATKGWVLQLHGSLSGPGALTVQVHAQDAQGTLHANATQPPTLADFSAYRGKWTHIALAYDCDGGDNHRGIWHCYLNGVLAGMKENDIAPRDGGIEADGQFKFSAVNGSAAAVWYGKFDCWRVSKTVLRPTQLLCASEDCEAATDVLALWPLNSQRGAVLDGTDVVGSYTFLPEYNAKYLPVACTDAPAVPGVSTAANGSIGFGTGTGGTWSYLLLNSNQNAFNAFTEADGGTFEMYVKRTGTNATSPEFFFIGTFAPADFDHIGDMRTNFNYNDAKGCCLYVNGLSWASGTTTQGSDAQFKDADGKIVTLPQNVWTHVALTRALEDGKQVFRLYLNGELKGSVTATGTPAGLNALYIGGRPSVENGFRGQFACLRISRGARAPETLLCASTESRMTVAYWPLDAKEGGVDLAGRVRGPEGLSTLTGQGSVSALTTGARATVPRPDETVDFVGDRRTNSGAIALGAGAAAGAGAVGGEMDVRSSFTVEGWIRWDGALGAAREVIAGTYDPSATLPCGWQLVLDSTGAAPTLRLFARGRPPIGVIAEGVLLEDASALRDEWHHVALRYDVARGAGTWSLLLDGRETGSEVVNKWVPTTSLHASAFRLGAFTGDTSFVGSYDMWRVSRGVCGGDDILWELPHGTTIIMR